MSGRGPATPPDPRYEDPVCRLYFARLVTHYRRHAAWLEDGALLRDIDKLTGIPGMLIHGHSVDARGIVGRQ
jgi:proline iminopeptidase